MYILGISSAQKIVDVALLGDKGLIAHFSLNGKNLQTENLVQYIDKVLKGNVSLEKISGIAITIGPGSYGGLRGGLSLAKSIAQVYGIPILSVSTLEAIAYNLVQIEGTILVATLACKDDLNLALFGASQGSLKRLTEDLVIKKDNLLHFISKIKGNIYFLGDKDIVRGVASPNLRIGGELNSLPKASHVAKLGEEKLKKGEILNFASTMPRYSHEPNVREYKQ